MEEVGLKVKNLRYYKSQPWSFSGTLLFGFFCDVDGDDTLTVDHEELSMAQWVERDKIPDQGNNISLTKEMMMLFRDGKEPDKQYSISEKAHRIFFPIMLKGYIHGNVTVHVSFSFLCKIASLYSQKYF